jgi:hypothetical protein
MSRNVGIKLPPTFRGNLSVHLKRSSSPRLHDPWRRDRYVVPKRRYLSEHVRRAKTLTTPRWKPEILQSSGSLGYSSFDPLCDYRLLKESALHWAGAIKSDDLEKIAIRFVFIKRWGGISVEPVRDRVELWAVLIVQVLQASQLAYWLTEARCVRNNKVQKTHAVRSYCSSKPRTKHKIMYAVENINGTLWKLKHGWYY